MTELDVNTSATKRRIHPLVATAAVSVTVLSLAGVGALTGLISSPLARDASTQVAVAPLVPAMPAMPAPAVAPVASSASADIGQPPQAAAGRPVQTDAPHAPQAPKAVVPEPAPRVQAPARTAPRPVQPRPVARDDERSAQPPAPRVATVDPNLGTVLSISRVEEPGSGSAVGVIGGGVVGGVLGNQVGRGNGRKAMTVLGAIGGAVAGNAIEKKVRADAHYEVVVRLADGSTRTMRYAEQPGFEVGERIRVEGARAS